MKMILKRQMKSYKQKFIIMINHLFCNRVMFDCTKTLIKLSILLFVAVLIVIRGSTAPLLFDNSILRFVLCTNPNGDKTLYNIGISVIAAFIFYVFQVYIPEYKKNRSYCSTFSRAHRQEIFLLNQFTLAWKEFLGKEPGKCHFFEFSYELDSDTGAVTKQTYKETIEELPKILNEIIKYPLFDDCDIAYKLFIKDSFDTICGHLKFMEDQFPRWSDEPLYAEDYTLILSGVIRDMERIQNRLSSIEKYYLKLLKVEPYEKSKLQNLIEKI